MDLDDIPRVAFLPIMKLSKWIDRHQGSVHFADLDSDSDMLNTYSSFLPKLVLVTFEDSQDPERFLEQINSDICISLHLDCYCTPRSYDWSPFVAELQNHDSQVKALTFGNCVPKTIASALPTLSIKELEVHHPRWDWIDLSQLHTFKSLEKLFFYLDYHQSGYVHYFDSTSITNLANCLVKGSLLEVWFRVETGSILFGALVNLPYSTDFPVISHQLCGDKYVVWKIRH
ncbi:hypothetical protein BC830DRAFT_143329 [Chytriomyces sp. MP71]|nr:hypothetical protein BC830DRAFT_143329 [Chytriomyces sp. MP71]